MVQRQPDAARKPHAEPDALDKSSANKAAAAKDPEAAPGRGHVDEARQSDVWGENHVARPLPR